MGGTEGRGKVEGMKWEGKGRKAAGGNGRGRAARMRAERNVKWDVRKGQERILGREGRKRKGRGGKEESGVEETGGKGSLCMAKTAKNASLTNF